MEDGELRRYAQVARDERRRLASRFDRWRLCQDFGELARINVEALAAAKMLADGDWRVGQCEGLAMVRCGNVEVEHRFFQDPSWGGRWSWIAALLWAWRRAQFAMWGRDKFLDRQWMALASKIASADARQRLRDGGDLPAGLAAADEAVELGAQCGSAAALAPKSKRL
jgi:hypothetical protein